MAQLLNGKGVVNDIQAISGKVGQNQHGIRDLEDVT